MGRKKKKKIFFVVLSMDNMILLPPFSCSFIAFYWQNRESKENDEKCTNVRNSGGERETLPVLPPLLCVSVACFLCAGSTTQMLV